MTRVQIQEWKREQAEKGVYPVVVQPDYETLVRLGPMRFGMAVRLANGRWSSTGSGPPAFGKPR
jgi:hypothetical protein